MESPFSSRLDSYYVPTDSESLEIRSFIELPTSRLEVLTIQLQELEEQSTKIRNEQSELRLFISKHRAMISPIRKLPIDILQEIFIACLPTDHNHLISRWEPPILLTQICSFWRNLAHATPQLWKSIHIKNIYGKSMGGTDFLSTTADAIVEWLTRSAACPLDISLDHSNSEDGFYYKIIDSLILFSERWREIRLSAPYHALLPIASLPISTVPLLEALSLNYPFQSAPSVHLDPQWVTSGVLNAPNLRDFGLSLNHLNWDATLLPLNWSQLTNISLEGSSSGSMSPLSTARAYKLLSFCRNLITCRLEIGNLTEDDELISFQSTTAVISLPFLTRLSVREEFTSVSRLFTLLHLPSLNYIEFHTVIEPTEQSSISLLSLLTRFQTTTKLVTDPRYYTRLDFINCLRLCPLLKSLYIQESSFDCFWDMEIPPHIPYCKIDDAFMRLFFEPSSNEGYLLCPHLEDFEITCTSEARFSETTLLHFVKEKNGDSTTTGLAKLKKLYVSFYGAPLGDIIQELEPYEAAGLVASLSYRYFR